MTNFKVTTLAAVLAFAAGSVAAQELDFPTWQAEDPSFAPWWNMVIDEFEARHPGVTVNMHTIPYSQYVDQMTVSFAGGNPPDIVHLPSRNFVAFANNGWFMPLDDFLADTDIIESWTPLQEGMMWDGAYQGVLLLGYGTVMYINDDIFEAAGTDPETAQLVWEFLQITTEPEFQTAYVLQTAAPAPRVGSLSEEQLAAHPDLALIDAAGAAAISTLPEETPLMESYAEYQNHLVETAIRLQTEDTPIEEIPADLQEELERRIPLD